MTDKLPGATATNSSGELERVSIFSLPGTEEEEVSLWEFFEEEAASNKNTRVSAAKYERNTCHFCKEIF